MACIAAATAYLCVNSAAGCPLHALPRSPDDILAALMQAAATLYVPQRQARWQTYRTYITTRKRVSREEGRAAGRRPGMLRDNLSYVCDLPGVSRSMSFSVASLYGVALHSMQLYVISLYLNGDHLELFDILVRDIALWASRRVPLTDVRLTTWVGRVVGGWTGGLPAYLYAGCCRFSHHLLATSTVRLRLTRRAILH